MSDHGAPAMEIPTGGAAGARATAEPAWLPGGAIVEVAVTTAAPGRYHYRVPPHLAGKAALGSRVLAKFGGKKLTAVIVKTGTEPPSDVAPLDLGDVLDTEPSLSPELVELCLWIAEYYEAPPGEVLKAALPAGSGVTANAFYVLTDTGRAAADGQAGGALPAKQRALLLRLGEEALAATGLNAGTRALLAALVEAGWVEQRDERTAATQLKKERVVRVIGDLVAARGRANAVKRNAVIAALAELTGDAVSTNASERGGPDASMPVRLAELEARVKGARGVIRDLEKAGVVRVEEREAALTAVAIGDQMHVSAPPELTGEQAHAVAEISGAVRASAFKPFLLFGVTGSGKTEVYLRVIAEALEAGKNALVLVPEISLTPQLAARFRARFGDLVAILHSGLSEQARLGEWSRLRRGEARIAVGARSAVFAPLAHVGVIVVDEEHDGSFKQDEGVKYHARDVALVRAQKAGAVCVLGSGTPSLESNAQAERGAYGKLVLTQRPMSRPMPAVEVIDLRTWQPDGDAFLAAPLRTAIGEALVAGDQIILFLNRRGFATFVVCVGCGHAFRCPNCSVSLTYHRHGERLACHYCGHTEKVPDQCPSCESDRIQRKGLGTEKIAAAVAEAFPAARVARLDRDVTSGTKIEAVLGRVARREVDILVGTQMVTKGHDFPGVTLVGVLCADTGLNLPDFRASERTFQLLAQVAGRAGRGDKPGKVIIQTYRPTAPAVQAAAAHDYERFYAAEVEERREHDYPPHGRLIVIRIDGPDEHEVAGVAHRVTSLCEAAESTLDRERAVTVLGPSESPLKRLRGRSRWQVMLRSKDRAALRWVARQSYGVDKPSRVRITVDVDPNSAL